jgi:ribosomal protein S6
MADIDKQNYELAFQITANLEDSEVQKTRQDLDKMVTSYGGTITFSKDAEKVRLAYPIKHQTSAFFGYVDFNLEDKSAVEKIRDDMRMNSNVLRYLIIKQESQAKLDKEDIVRKMAAAERRKVKAAKLAEKPAQKTDEPKIDEKQIDDKLEEIIDKL